MVHRGYSSEDLFAIHTLEDEGGTSFPLVIDHISGDKEQSPPPENIIRLFAHGFIEIIKKLWPRKSMR